MVRAAAITAALLFLVTPLSAHAAREQSAGYGACLHYAGHVYEACFAYVVNDSTLALRKYYQLGRSRDSNRAAGAGEDLAYRYRGSALNLIQRRVAHWPKGENVVVLPRISIVSATSSLATNTARLTTRETWTVRTTSGRLLYRESNRTHRIKMARVQGNFLHVWVVTAID
jgi:hypothetical protein